LQTVHLPPTSAACVIARVDYILVTHCALQLLEEDLVDMEEAVNCAADAFDEDVCELSAGDDENIWDEEGARGLRGTQQSTF